MPESGMPIVATRKSEQNDAAFDPWSAVHFTSGLAFGLMGVSAGVSMAAAVVFDVVEQGVERSEAGQKFFNTSGPESLANVACDLALFGVGWWLADAYNRT